MIRIERSSVPRPEILDPEGRAVRLEREKAAQFIAEGLQSRQQRFAFKIYHHRSISEALAELFHGKCAYCEAKVTLSQPIDIELFRPKASVLESPKRYSEKIWLKIGLEY